MWFIGRKMANDRSLNCTLGNHTYFHAINPLRPQSHYSGSDSCKYYLKHCHQFVWYIHLEVRVKWQIQHKAKPSAIFVTRLSPRVVYTIQRKQQCFKCFILFFALTKC